MFFFTILTHYHTSKEREDFLQIQRQRRHIFVIKKTFAGFSRLLSVIPEKLSLVAETATSVRRALLAVMVGLGCLVTWLLLNIFCLVLYLCLVHRLCVVHGLVLCLSDVFRLEFGDVFGSVLRLGDVFGLVFSLCLILSFVKSLVVGFVLGFCDVVLDVAGLSDVFGTVLGYDFGLVPCLVLSLVQSCGHVLWLEYG